MFLDALSLFAVLAVTALALYLLTIFMLARILTRPPRLTDARALARLNRMSPADLSLPFESIDFKVRDERTGQPLQLSAWWIARPQSDRCAILLHGYADAKIGSIAWAPLMLELGYHVLAVDLRAHGHSDGRDTTAGYFERHDISQVIDQLRTLRPGKTRQIILLGISMGAAVAAATANVRDDIAAIILDSPYAHFRQAARAHASHAGLPGDIFLRGGWNLAQWQTGAHFEEVDPVKTIPTARCPVMVISATKDLLVSPDEQAALQSAIHSRSDSSEFWTQDADHVLNLPSNPEEYLGRMRQFLMNLPKPSATNS